ncbi:MAG: hypothetical protein LT070_04760 [Solirubrobacteraceae bacterium]|nr:hypothetical protein [Solirubrobacteraceae bacterium]
MTVGRVLLLALGVALFLLGSLVLALWLTGENRERAVVTRVLRAQAAGDGAAMTSLLEGCRRDGGCRAATRRLARMLRRPGEVRIVGYDSATAHALLAERGPTRVAWMTGAGSPPVVQCLDVERLGLPLLGGRVVAHRIGPRIAGTASCPR